MALRTDQLHEENSKLRQEIRKLQAALRTMKVDEGENSTKSPVRSPRWKMDEERREEIVRETMEKVGRGVFEPPKQPVRGRNRERSGSRSMSRDNSLPKLPSSDLHSDLSQELSGIEASLDTIQSVNPGLAPSLKSELAKLRKSVKRFTSKSPSREETTSRKETEEWEETVKGRTLAEQIEALRIENEYLRGKLAGKPSGSAMKSPKRKTTERSRSNSPTPSKSPRCRSPYSRSPSGRTPRASTSPGGRSSRSKSPLRHRHCKVCDYLLSKGFSTVYCSKHGSK